VSEELKQNKKEGTTRGKMKGNTRRSAARLV
jgi:hypothetical protein